MNTKPMLSDEELGTWQGRDWYPNMSIGEVRDFYEAKIVSGELMVVSLARMAAYPPFNPGEIMCSSCTNPIGNLRDGVPKLFCPACGAQFTNA